jgi:large subunit ribosomal protein L24
MREAPLGVSFFEYTDRTQTMDIKTGDLIEVITGKDKSKTGRVTRVDRERNRVYVDGVNQVVRNQKPSQTNEGGRITKSASIHVSNVRLYSEEDGRGYRVGHRFVGQDEALYTSKDAAMATFSDAPGRIAKVRVFLKKGGELTRVAEPQRGESA